MGVAMKASCGNTGTKAMPPQTLALPLLACMAVCSPVGAISTVSTAVADAHCIPIEVHRELIEAHREQGQQLKASQERNRVLEQQKGELARILQSPTCVIFGNSLQ